MPVPTLITELSLTPATNSPPGSESPSSIDDYLRAHASFTALLRDSKADLASPTLTGTPSATTPARFDRSTRIATMAAIGAEQGSLAGQLAINVSQAIAAGNGGSEINASGTITLTLPVGAAVPAGAAFIINNSGVGVVTIVPTGSDVLKRIDAAAGNIVLGAGDATTIVFAGGTLFNARVFVADANKPLSTVASNSLGMRNRIINGDMRIDQRNNGVAVTVSGGGELYHVDRWSYSGTFTGGAQTAQRSFDAPIGVANTSVNITQINANTTAGGSDYCIRQRVELVNVSDLAGKVITVSFWYKSSRTGTHGARVIGSLSPATVGGVDQALPFTVNAADVWEYKTLVFNTATAFITSWGATSNNAGALILDIGFKIPGVGQTAAVVGDFFRVTAVQLEVGSVATPLERRQVGLEVLLCQRYFQRHTALATTVASMYSQKLPTVMRTTPTFTTTFDSGTGAAYTLLADGQTFFNSSAHNVTGTATLLFSSEL